MQESEASARDGKAGLDHAPRRDRGQPYCSALQPWWPRSCVVEWMLRVGILNRYIVPLPSEVILSFPRIVIEERILDRFLTTFMECFYAMLLVAVDRHLAGVLLYRFTALRAATETWVAAAARRRPSCWRIRSSW